MDTDGSFNLWFKLKWQPKAFPILSSCMPAFRVCWQYTQTSNPTIEELSLMLYISNCVATEREWTPNGAREAPF